MKSLISYLSGFGMFAPIAYTNFVFDAGWFDIHEIEMIPVIVLAITLVNYGLVVFDIPTLEKTLLSSFAWVAMMLGIPNIPLVLGANAVTPIQVAFGQLSLSLSSLSVAFYLLLYIGKRIPYKRNVMGLAKE